MVWVWLVYTLKGRQFSLLATPKMVLKQAGSPPPSPAFLPIMVNAAFVFHPRHHHHRHCHHHHYHPHHHHHHQLYLNTDKNIRPYITVCLFDRTKYEVRDKQQQGRITTLEKEKKSLNDELTSTVSELTQVQPLLNNNNNNRNFILP